MLNPWITNSFIDSCAFDPKYDPEQNAAIELHKLCNEHDLLLLIAHSTKKEIDHPSTPQWVKREASMRIQSVATNRTREELETYKKIHAILTGNGKPEKHAEDAEHIMEAQKYGSYFVTTDKRILSKVVDLQSVCNAIILRPSQFLQIVTEFKT